MNLEKIVLDFFGFVGGINFASFGSILLFTLVIFWLVVVGWVWADSGERTSKRGIRVLYTLIALVLNIPGLIIYLIVRPSETIEEIYWADLERRYLKYETSELGDCPSCGAQLYPGFVHCSDCGYQLKKKCPSCEVLVDKDNKYCVHCGFQLAKRLKAEEEYPTVEVMQQQILATREEATQRVEGKRTRYKSGKSIVIKIGDSILSAFSTVKEFVQKNLSKKKEDTNREEPKNSTEKKVDTQNQNSNQSSRNRNKKKKKKNKRR